MKSKKVIILLAVFLGLCLITGLNHYWSDKQGISQCFISVNEQEISKIEIIRKEELFVFEKKEDLWQIMQTIQYPANQSLMIGLIDYVRKLTLDGIISTNPQKHRKFQVDQKEGVQVSFYNREGKKLVNFILGKMGTDYMHYYFRFPDEQKVYLSKGVSRNFVDKEIEKWRDRTILALNKDALEEVSLIYFHSDKKKQKREEIKLIKKDDKWLLEKEEVDSNIWDRFLNNLTKLDMDDLVEGISSAEEKTKFGLQKPSFQIIIKLKDNQEEEIVVGDKNEKNQYYVQRKGVETIFLVSSHKIDNLRKIEKKEDIVK